MKHKPGENSPIKQAPVAPKRRNRLAIRELLKPHLPALLLGFLAVAGEGAANLLEPWPLKIVLDNVLRSQQSHAAIMRRIQMLVGTDKLAMLKFLLRRSGDCGARRYLHIWREVSDHQRRTVGHIRFAPDTLLPYPEAIARLS